MQNIFFFSNIFHAPLCITLLGVQLPILDLYQQFLSSAYVCLGLWFYQVLKGKQDWSSRTGQRLKRKPLIKADCCSKRWQHLRRDALISDRWLVGWDTQGESTILFKYICDLPSYSAPDTVELFHGICSFLPGCELSSGREKFMDIPAAFTRGQSFLLRNSGYWVS